MKLLHVDSSILGANSVSRQLSHEVVDALAAADPTLEVVTRDLAAHPLPHLDMANLPTSHPIAQAADKAAEAAPSAARVESQAALDEFLAADIVVVGAPMYNFSVPSQLKAWIDRILVPGATFKYGANGPEGLVKGKRVVVVAARGGFYGQGSPYAAFQHLESYLESVFGFMGVTDLQVILAEGLSAGPDNRKNAVDAAVAAARELKAAA